MLFAIDTDFDGVDDELDQCLGTSLLDVVTDDGCSKSQKSQFTVTLLQSYSYLKVDNNTKLDNYSLALMLSKDTWLLYMGSGYFKFDNPNQKVEDFSDTTLLLQKTFMLSSSHLFKTSISMVLPTYNDSSNKTDYGADIAYLYAKRDFDVEMGYQYDLINDDNSQNIQTAYIYAGYNLSNTFHVILGYTKDNEKRENQIFLLQYLYDSKLNFSYSFTKGKNNFYDTIHSMGMNYSF